MGLLGKTVPKTIENFRALCTGSQGRKELGRVRNLCTTKEVHFVEGCNRIRELKETILLLDVDLVDSARQIQELNVTRSNLLALQQKLRLILYVNQALSALKLLQSCFLFLFPVLWESDFTPEERVADADGIGASLASKLRSLSSESFVQLLSAIFLIVRAHLVRSAEVKKAIEWIMCNLDGHYAADSVAAALAVGAQAAETAQESDGQGGLLMSYSSPRVAAKALSFQGKANDATSPSTTSKNFR